MESVGALCSEESMAVARLHGTEAYSTGLLEEKFKGALLGNRIPQKQLAKDNKLYSLTLF